MSKMCVNSGKSVKKRLFYRLLISNYRERFILKGGALLYAHDPFEARPTLDIDFMATRINNDKENIKLIVKEICNVECAHDEVSYDADTLEAEDIAVNKEYHGVRGFVVAEQFYAMIVLFGANSRMKDFFDVYRILVTDWTMKFCRMPLNLLLQIGKQVIGRITPYLPKSFSYQKTANLSGMALYVK